MYDFVYISVSLETSAICSIAFADDVVTESPLVLHVGARGLGAFSGCLLCKRPRSIKMGIHGTLRLENRLRNH